MMYVMVLVGIVGLSINVTGNGVYQSKESCEFGRSILLSDENQPMVNYAVICIATDQPKTYMDSL